MFSSVIFDDVFKATGEGREMSWAIVLFNQAAVSFALSYLFTFFKACLRSQAPVHRLLSAPAQNRLLAIVGCGVSALFTVCLWHGHPSWMNTWSDKDVGTCLATIALLGGWLGPLAYAATEDFPAESVAVELALQQPIGSSDEVVEQASVHEAFRIPADAFPCAGPRASGHVVLEADRIIGARGGQNETLVALLRTELPSVMLEEYPGDRSYARVKVRLQDEAVVREAIKIIARSRRRRANVKDVPGTRVFDSPRD